MDDVLFFYNNLRLPDAYLFAKAYLELKCEAIQNTSITSFNPDYKKVIINYFELNKEITEETVFKFIRCVSECANYSDLYKPKFNNPDIKFPVEIQVYVWCFIDLIKANLDENFINLEYGKKYTWQYDFNKRKYNVDKFLEYYGLEKFFKKYVSKKRMKENLKKTVICILGVISFFLFMRLLIYFIEKCI